MSAGVPAWPIPDDYVGSAEEHRGWARWGRRLIAVLRERDPVERRVSESIIVPVTFDHAGLPAVVVEHNLSAEVGAASDPNVLWTVLGTRHSGAGGGNVGIEYVVGTAITANSISLVATTTTRTINGANPLRAMLRFERWVPW